MRKSYILLAVIALFSTQSVFAMDSKACGTVAKACIDGGYTLGDEAAAKKFWHDCMKPLLLDKQVSGVTVDAATVKECRTDKINEMKKELPELEKMNSKK